MKISQREKNLLLFVGGGAIIIAAIYQWVITPIQSNQEAVREKISSKSILLEKSGAKIIQKESLGIKSNAIEEKIADFEKRLLSGKTPSLAAAELQKLLKKIAKNAKAEVSSEKIIAPIDVGEYQKIPVQVTVKCLVTDLKNFLHKIESNKIILPISEASIKVINSRQPSKVEATITIAGIIKKKPGTITAEQISTKKKSIKRRK